MGKPWDKRRPGEQRSPYEAIGRGGKGQIERPQATSHVQGCGDPTCSTCMPKGNPAGAGGALGGIPSEVLREMAADINKRIWSDFTVSVGGVDLGRVTNVTVPRLAAADDSARARYAAEERRLRPQVERFFLKTAHAVAWDDVVGNDLAREALVDAIEHPIKHAALYAHYGMRPSKGVLLYGPPGCGKTMFGKAAASVLTRLHGQPAGGATLLSIKGPEIQSPYVGVTEGTIRAVFAYARAFKALHGFPLVVFIDEADAILPSRDGSGTGRRALPWEESNVATFLTEMDGLEDSGAFVVLATNRPGAIDAALLRDGRCDRKIKVERPTEAAAEAILVRALRGVPLAAGCEAAATAAAATASIFSPFHHVARVRHDRGVGYLRLRDIVNGAMLVSLVEQAKARAFRRDLAAGGAPGSLTADDLEHAVGAVLRQNRGLVHGDALTELADELGWVVRSVDTMPAPRVDPDTDGREAA